MKTQVTATFVGGVLKPDEELPLADQTRVNLTVETIADQPNSVAAWELLKAMIRQKPIHAAGLHFTRDELHERR